MPFAERALFTDNKRLIRGKNPKAIYERVLEIMRNVGPLTGIAERAEVVSMRAMSLFEVTSDHLDVTYHISPPEHDSGCPILLAPGTPLLAEEQTRADVPKAAIEAARTALGYMSDVNRIRLSHKAAVDLVEFIMTREGKMALVREIAATNPKWTYEEVYHGLHAVAERSLGPGYEPTRSEIVIRGNSWTAARRAEQVGGGLRPDRTRADVGIYKRWTLRHPPRAPGEK